MEAHGPVKSSSKLIKDVHQDATPVLQVADAGHDSRTSEQTLAASRHDALRRYLNRIELAEINHYERVYFFDHTAQRVAPRKDGFNQGYDTIDGVYQCYKHDHIAYRFELLSNLGYGSFGDVLHAYDYKNERDVAIKIVINNENVRSQAFHEAILLEALQPRRQHERCSPTPT